MYIPSSLALVALAGIAYGQTTPESFKPSTNNRLEILFNSTSVSKPGQLLSKATTASPPRIAISSAQGNLSDTYMFVMLDLDVPPQRGGTERHVLLHALNTGFKATRQRLNGTATVLVSSQTGPAMYIPPGPPATDTIPHRYVELLFHQPATLNVRASTFANITGRLDFDITKFMAENQLGSPLAGTFFTVDGRVNSTTSTESESESEGGSGSATATGSGGLPSNSVVPFEGAAGKREISYGIAGLLSGLVVLMM